MSPHLEDGRGCYRRFPMAPFPSRIFASRRSDLLCRFRQYVPDDLLIIAVDSPLSRRDGTGHANILRACDEPITPISLLRSSLLSSVTSVVQEDPWLCLPESCRRSKPHDFVWTRLGRNIMLKTRYYGSRQDISVQSNEGTPMHSSLRT